MTRRRPLPPHKLWLWRDLAILLIACGLLGTILDQIHVRTGTLSYERPEFAGQAWWVAGNFAIMLVMAVWSGTMIANRKGMLGVPRTYEDRPAWTGGRTVRTRIVIDLGWFVLAYLISGAPAFGWGGAEWVRVIGLVALTLLAIVRLKLRGSYRTALVALGLAFIGPAYEGFIASLQLFVYQDADIAHVPLWLPALYANGAPLVVSLGAWLDERGWQSRTNRQQAAQGEELLGVEPLGAQRTNGE